MDSTALTVWNSFLRSAPAELSQYITPELLEQLQSQPLPSEDLRHGIPPIVEELTTVHFSWFTSPLRTLPENEIRLFLSPLTPEQVKGLKASLLLANSLPTTSSIGMDFLKKMMFEMIASVELVPVTCLPVSPLNALLALSHSELTSLIDLLSMHDLSVEIRHIIETTKLKEIYNLLSKAQTTLLKTLIHKKETVTFKRMGLVAWNGDREALRSLLLQRGINRIAKALYGQHPSLLWHVAHHLDAEKGQLLTQLCTPLDHPKASFLLAEQVVELIGSFKSTNTPHTP
jgi:hypothetical protein